MGPPHFPTEFSPKHRTELQEGEPLWTRRDSTKSTGCFGIRVGVHKWFINSLRASDFHFEYLPHLLPHISYLTSDMPPVILAQILNTVPSGYKCLLTHSFSFFVIGLFVS